MTSHTRRVLELGAGLALALTVVLTAYADWHQRTAARVRADTVRLHILANSDSCPPHVEYEKFLMLSRLVKEQS